MSRAVSPSAPRRSPAVDPLILAILVVVLLLEMPTVPTMASDRPTSGGLADPGNAQIIGVPRASCDARWLSVRLETNVRFHGRVYVNGRAFDRRCSESFTQNQSNAVLVRLSILDCANVERHNATAGANAAIVEPLFLVWVNVRVDFHPTFITRTSQVFRVECAAVRGLDYDPPRQGVGPVNTICAHQLTRDGEPSGTPPLREINVGELIQHRWGCSDKYGLRRYAMLVRNCDVLTRSRHAVQLLDSTGCTVDETLLTNLSANAPRIRVGGAGAGKDDAERLITTAQSHAFKFLEEAELRFRCVVALIPRAADYAAVEIPKCSISKEELRETAGRGTDDAFQFVTPNPRFPGVIETVTLTQWIRVAERLPIRNFDHASPLTNAAVPSALAGLEHNGTAPTRQFFPSRMLGIVTAGQRTDDDFCAWRAFNWTLLVWSTASTLVWLGVLGRKVHVALRERHNGGDASETAGASSLARHSYKFPGARASTTIAVTGRLRQTPYGKKYRHRPRLASGGASDSATAAAAAWLSDPTPGHLRRFPARF